MIGIEIFVILRIDVVEIQKRRRLMRRLFIGFQRKLANAYIT